MPEQPKPDWFVSSLNGQIPDTSKLFAQGIGAQDFQLLAPDAYWADDVVKQKFAGDKKAFDTHYAGELGRYEKSKASDRELNNFVTAFFPTKLSQQVGKPQFIVNQTTSKADPWGRIFINGEPGNKQYGIREKANERGVKMSDGKMIPLSQYDGMTRFAKDDSGQFKLDDKGLPYHEPLAEGQEMRSFDESYNQLSDISGNYGFEYGWKQAAWSPVKNLANFVTGSLDALAEFPRSMFGVNQELTNSKSGEYNSIKDFQNQMRAWQVSSTEEGMNDFWSMENVIDIAQQAAFQLGGMASIARGAKALGAGAKTASTASRMFMTGISAAPLAQISREHGLSDTETAMLMYATLWPLYKISALSDKAINGLKPIEFQAKVADMTKEAYGVIAKDGINAGSLRKFQNRLTTGLSRTLYGMENTGLGRITQTGLLESMEETAEQGVDFAARGLYDTFRNITNQPERFNIDLGQEANMLLQSAAGGAIGGAAIAPVMRKIALHQPQIINSYEDAIAQGEEGNILAFIDNYRKNSRFGDTPEENDQNANMLKSVVSTMVDIRDRAGVKDVVKNNVEAAGEFSDVLKMSSIGKEGFKKANELRSLEVKQEELAKQGQSDETIDTRINDIKKEIADLVSGRSVNRFVAEGIYNTLTAPEIRKKVPGSQFLKLNDDTKEAHPIVQDQRKLEKEKYLANDAIATLENFKELGVTEAGKNRLLKELTDARNSFQSQLTNLPKSDTYPNPITYDDYFKDELSDDPDEQAKQITKSQSEDAISGDFYEDELELLSAQDPALAPQLETFKALRASIAAMNKVSSYSPVDIQDATLDDLILHDIEPTGKISQATIDDKITQQEVEAKPKNKDEISLYIDSANELPRLRDVITARMLQIRGNQLLQGKLPEESVLYPIQDPERLNSELERLSDRVDMLHQLSEENKKNSEARIREIYLQNRDKELDNLEKLAEWMASNEFSEIGKKLVEALDPAIDGITKKDVTAHLKGVISMEETLYAEIKSKKDAILSKMVSEVEGRDDKWLSTTDEGKTYTQWYNYIRGLATVRPATLYKAIRDTVEESSEKALQPTDEHQYVAVQTIRGLRAGQYDLRPGHTSGDVMTAFQAGIDGASGVGKTATMIPLVAGAMAKLDTGSKVILTAANDSENAKRTKIVADTKAFFGELPKFIKQTNISLSEIVQNASLNEDVTLIVFDEATLIPIKDIKQINQDLIGLNNTRIKDGKTPLHILYTFDRYQNSAKAEGTSVVSPRVKMPISSRLTYSFRSQNVSLKMAETYFREIQDGIKPAFNSFQYDSNNGFQVFKNRAEMHTALENLYNRLSKDGKPDMVYIRTNEGVSTPEVVTRLGLPVLTSEDAQGREWDYIIVDDNTGELTGKERQKEYYTGVTRAKKLAYVFVSPNTDLGSVRATVSTITPMRATPTTKEALVTRYDKALGDLKNTPTEVNKATVTIAPAERGAAPVPLVAPTADATPDEVERYNVSKIMNDNLPSTTQLSTFYTTSESPTKKLVLYDKATREASNYQITIAKIGTPEYTNIINNDPSFSGRFGVMLEAVSPTGEVVVMGVLKDMDKAITDAGIMSGREKLTLAISKRVFAESSQHHPFVINKKNGEGKNISPPKTLGMIRQSSKGIVFSKVLIVQQEDGIKVGDKIIRRGQSFVVASYKHTQEQLNDDVVKKNIVSDPNLLNDVTLIPLDTKSDFTVDQVVELVKPYLEMKPGGRAKLPSSESVNKLVYSFWDGIRNRPDLDAAFKMAQPLMRKDSDIIKLITDKMNFAKKDSYNLSWLLRDYIEDVNSATKPAQARAKTLRKMIDIILAQSDFGGKLRFRPASQWASTKDYAYVAAASLPGQFHDNYLSNRLDFVSLPVVNLSKNVLISSIVAPGQVLPPPEVGEAPRKTQPDANTAQVTPSLSSVEVKDSNLDPVSLIYFRDTEFKGEKRPWMISAIRKFRADVANAQFKLTGDSPSLLGIDQAIKELRKEYGSEVNTKADTKEAYITRAINRHFNGLLAKYFPAVKYNLDADQYTTTVDHIKTEEFGERERFSLIDDGMTNLVKTYLYNTPVYKKENGNWVLDPERYITKRDIFHLLPLFKGVDSTPELQSRIEQILSGAVPVKTESIGPLFSLYTRYFSNTPVPIQGVKNHSVLSVSGTEEGWALVDTIFQFLKSGEVFQPGWTEATTKKRANRYNTSSHILPNIAKSVVLQSIENSVKSIYKQGKIIGLPGSLVEKKEQYSVNDVINAYRLLGAGSTFSAENFHSYYSSDPLNQGPKGDTYYSKQLMSYFFKAVDAAATGSRVPLGQEIDPFLEHVLTKERRGNNFQYVGRDGVRKDMMRYSAPVYRMKSVIDLINTVPSSPVHNNLLVKADREEKPMFSIDHSLYFVDEGVRYRNGKVDREKPTSRMFEDELLEHFIIDGFVTMIPKSGTAYFPVTVYSDSSVEPGIMFKSDDWFRSPDKTLKALFASRADYYLKMQERIVATLASDSFPNTVKLISSLSPEQALASDLIYNLDYTISKDGRVATKPSLIADVEFYTNPANEAKFLEEKKAAAQDLVNKSKNIFDAQGVSTYEKIAKIGRDHSPDEYLKAYFYNWLAISSEFQKISNGPAQQFKGDGIKEYFDMIKRSKSQSSPRNSWVLRDPSWKPNSTDPRNLYEGSKLPANIKVAVITDPTVDGINLDTGLPYKQEIYDGATFVTPFTRIAQEYSNGLKFGNFVGPVMKNVTTSFNVATATNSYIKNAEYLLTPEIMRNAGPMAERMFKNMLTSVDFSNPAIGAKNALELVTKIAGAEPLTMDHFRKAYAEMVKHGVQDDIIHEVIPRSSYKSGQSNVNNHLAEKYQYDYLNMSEKGTQQDSNKNPFNGLDTRALSQLFDTVLINWRDDGLLRQFYDTLSSITREEMDALAKLPEASRQEAIRRMMRDSILTNEGADYRTEAVMAKDFSFSDRALSGVMATTISNYIAKRAISFALRGGQFTVHPSDDLVHVVDNEDGSVSLKSEAPGKPSRNLKWKDPVRVSDNMSLGALYLMAKSTAKDEAEYKRFIASIHQSLQDEQWTPGEAEILLPAEMKEEFMLEPAMLNQVPLNQINDGYFYNQLLASRTLDPKGDYPALRRRAEEINKSFQKRLRGLMTRIPTSGKHSSINTRVVGFINDSMNSVFAPSQMLRVQGADQDYDKGNYLTYRSVVWYGMKNKRVKGDKITWTLDRNFGGADWKVALRKPTGIIPIDLKEEEYYKLIGLEKALSPDDKKVLRRILNENKLVDLLEKIMSDPKNAVEVNTAVNDTMRPLELVRDELEDKSTYNYNQDDIFSLVKAHALNQAGGKALVGVFANSSKAYKLLYGTGKYTKKPVPFLAEFESPANTVWEQYSGLINAATDNGNAQILGPMDIDIITGPVVGYLVATGMKPEEARMKYILPYQEFWDRVRKMNRVDSLNSYYAANDPATDPEMRALLLRSEEWQVFASSIVNREIPNTQKDMFNYITSVENFVRRSFAKANKPVPFDFIRFVKDPDYARQMIDLYDSLISVNPDGTLNPLSNHTYNILRPFIEMPHIHQYTRALVMAHEMMLADKSYDTTFRFIRETQRLNPKMKMNSKTYDSSSKFVEMMKVDSYLKHRTMSHLSQYDINNHAGRVQFIAAMNAELGTFRSRYPNNYFIQSLDTMRLNNFVEGSDVIRTYDLFELTEEKIMEMSAALAELSDIDRQRFFVYNLITRQDSGSKGGFARFFSYQDKADWNSFISNEFNPDISHFINVKKRFDDLDAQLEGDPVDTTAIPYENTPVVGGLSFGEEIKPLDPYKGILLGETEIITARRVGGVAATRYTNQAGDPVIIYAPKALREKYDQKAWMKPVRMADGTIPTPLPEKIFTTYQMFRDFVVEHEYQHVVFKRPEGMPIAEYEDKVNAKALESFGIKVPANFQYKTIEQFEEEQRVCKL